MAKSLEARIAALELQHNVASEMLIVQILNFAADGSDDRGAVKRIIDGLGQVWLREADEAEAEFIARCKREAAPGTQVLVINNHPATEPAGPMPEVSR